MTSASPPIPPIPGPLSQVRSVNLAEILLDRGTQSRLGGNDPATVQRYAADMTAGIWAFERRPLPLLFFDGDCYYPGDGHHRIAAARQCQRTDLLCEVRPGGPREAQFFSNTEANKFHGKQLTRKDKRHRVRNLLLDPEWTLMSDREIARHCGVSAPFVGTIRRSLVAAEQITPATQRRGKDGKLRETAKIGKLRRGQASNGPERQGSEKQGSEKQAPPQETPAKGRPANPARQDSPRAIAPGHSSQEEVVSATQYNAVLQERQALQLRLTEQQRQHRLALAQVTAAAQADELRQALADDEALMQQLYDGLGTIAAALNANASSLAELQPKVHQAAQGIALMRRILEAKAPNLIADEESSPPCD